MKMFEGKSRIKLIKLPTHLHSQINKTNNKEKISKVAIAQTTDLIAYKIINTIIKGDIRKLNVKPVDKKIIKPLYLFLDKEVLLYAKLRKLGGKFLPTHPKKLKKISEKKDEISLFIDGLEKKQKKFCIRKINVYLDLILIKLISLQD